jgi:heat shock protein HslJ
MQARPDPKPPCVRIVGCKVAPRAGDRSRGEAIMNRLGLVLATALILGGCTHGGPPAAGIDASLQGRHWQLEAARDAHGQRIDVLFARPQQPLQLDFANGRMAVRHACNLLSGPYAIRDDRLQVPRLAQTMMACPPGPLARIDQAIASRLRDAPRMQVLPGPPPTLVLRPGNGDTLRFRGVPAR